MKTVIISKRSRALNALLRQVHRGGLILRGPDGREYILAETDDFNREIELTRQNKKLMQLLDERAKQAGTVSLREVKAKLAL